LLRSTYGEKDDGGEDLCSCCLVRDKVIDSPTNVSRCPLLARRSQLFLFQEIMATGPRVLYEFGAFRVDPDKQVLLRENQPVAVTPKAFETLLILLRHSREVVSKDELMNALWPDAFVEEANLSQNIFTLRKALGDTPEDRRYIITHPGKGYSFAETVRTITEGGDDLVIASRTRSKVVVEETDHAAGQRLKVLTGIAKGTRAWKYLSIAAVGLLLALTATVVSRRRQPLVLGEKDSVLIADFANTTGDSVFDGTLRQGLEVQLDQSPFLNLVAEQRVQQTLTLMGRPPDSRLSPELAQEICERTGSAAVLDGAISRLGSQYVLGLRAKNCRTGSLIDEEQMQAAKKEDILNALSHIASNFRTRVGESLATVEKYDKPLAEATTPSLEALKAYSMGLKVLGPQGEAAAIPFFKHAVEIDPKFAIAYAYLGLMYGSMGEPALATENTKKAYELRDRASDKEKFFISAYYDGRATGNQEKAQQTCQAWAETYPREFMPHSFLAGFIYPVLGKYEKAVEESRKNIELDPDAGIGYVALSSASANLNRMGDAEEALRMASDRKIDGPLLSLLRFDIAFLQGDNARMEREVAAALGKSGWEDWITDHQAFVLASAGRMQEAKNLSRRASDLARQASHRERAALFETRVALWDAFYGNAPAAKPAAIAALALAKNREVQYGAALALAMSGNSSQAQILANDLEHNFPEDTSVKFNYLPVVRASVALNHREPSMAVELLQTAVTYELGTPRSSIQGYFGALYPIYLRGQAFLAAHQGAEAAEEFQRILSHGRIMVGDPIVVLGHVGLARAYVLSGEKLKARAKYQDFLTLWKDADPDIPVLKQARAEYAKLQ
jgi:eukaryotic-like serine/threonine-protein kinase